MRNPLRLIVPPLLLCAACVGGDADDAGDGDDAPDGDCPTEGRYFELVEGASWTYRVVDESVTSKTQTVGPLEDVGGTKAGTLAHRMTTEKAGGALTISWQEDTGAAILRHREQDPSGSNTSDAMFEPFRTRFDGSADRIELGATWEESYTEVVSENGDPPTTTAKTETWTVEAVDEVIEVPAGTFCTLRVRRLSEVGGVDGSDKTYWFARGVGKIQEVGANQTETLVSYER